MCRKDLGHGFVCFVFVCVVFVWKQKNRWESLPGLGYTKACCAVHKDDKEGESQGDSEKLTEDITMRCHFNDSNTRAALQ